VKRTKKKSNAASSLPGKAQDALGDLGKQIIREQLALRARLHIDAPTREKQKL